jgi:hypothetical protein
LALFAALSGAIHAAAFGALERSAERARTSFAREPTPIAGETLDVDPPAEPEPEPQGATDEPTTVSLAAAPRPTPAPAHAAAPPERPGRLASLPGASPSASASPSTSRPATFGAVGVPYAADLARTFTGAFPQTASADSAWDTAPLGQAGTAEVSLVLDETGHLVESSVNGRPSPALRRGIERTLGLLAPRVFTARAAVTKLRLSARVSRDDVHDGLHGDVFALSGTGGSFSGDLGTAFFARPGPGGGRRVDVEVRLLP